MYGQFTNCPFGVRKLNGRFTNLPYRYIIGSRKNKKQLKEMDLILMNRKIITVLLSALLTVFNINGFSFAAEFEPMVYTENTASGNMSAYKTISIKNTDVTISAGHISAGKILVVSAILPTGGSVLNYVSAIGLNPTPGGFSGGWYSGSAMSYFKITQAGNYNITVRPKSGLSQAVSVDIYMYTVDYLDGFEKYDAIEGTSGLYNYVVSNTPEQLGEGNTLSIADGETSLYSDISAENHEDEYVKTVMIDGTERLLPKKSSTKLVKKNISSNTQSNRVVISDEIKQIIKKINSSEDLSLNEVIKYQDFIKKNNLEPVTTLGANATSQLGEYGYYLHKSKINGNANVFWEHINKYGSDMYYGILLQNTGGSNLTVTLNKRSYDSSYESDTNAMTSIWSDYFKGVKYDSADISGLSSSITIPANSARWVALYKVPAGTGCNTFNGQVSLSIKTSGGSAYTGSSLYSYSFIMTDWTNSSGTTMYQAVQNNIGNGTFTRAAGAGAYNISEHISGTGNGARLLKSVNKTIDITGDRYSFLLTGFDAPYLNSGELISLYHDGPTTGGSNGYSIANGKNYGVIYKISFKGFNSTSASENIKLKLKFNRMVNPGAVEERESGMYAMVYCPAVSSTPYTAFLGNADYNNNKPEATYPYNIPKNKAFDLYVVVGGMSSMPLEVQFFAK